MREPIDHVHVLNGTRKKETLNYSGKILKDEFSIKDLKKSYRYVK